MGQTKNKGGTGVTTVVPHAGRDLYHRGKLLFIDINMIAQLRSSNIILLSDGMHCTQQEPGAEAQKLCWKGRQKEQEQPAGAKTCWKRLPLQPILPPPVLQYTPVYDPTLTARLAAGFSLEYCYCWAGARTHP